MDLTAGIHFINDGYGMRGQPPQDHSLILRGKCYSAIGIMSVEGVQDIYITDGTVDGDRFAQFIHHTLLPILQPFDGRTPNQFLWLTVHLFTKCLK